MELNLLSLIAKDYYLADYLDFSSPTTFIQLRTGSSGLYFGR